MASYKSILPMMVLSILFFLTPTMPTKPSSSNRDGQNYDKKTKDLVTCFHNLVENCGPRDKFPIAAQCVRMGFLFWDEYTFSKVEDKLVKKVLEQYYLSFRDNIDTSQMWGTAAYCTHKFTVKSNQALCHLQLKNFEGGPGGQDDIIRITNEEKQAMYIYGESKLQAVRFGLYNTKLANYVKIPYANVHNIEELIKTNDVITSRNVIEYYPAHYMIYIASAFSIKNNAVKDPKDYCIEKFNPEMSEYLSDSANANAFFFFLIYNKKFQIFDIDIITLFTILKFALVKCIWY